MHTTLYFSINILLPPTSRRYFLIIFFDLLMDTYLEDDEGTGRKGDGLGWGRSSEGFEGTETIRRKAGSTRRQEPQETGN